MKRAVNRADRGVGAARASHAAAPKKRKKEKYINSAIIHNIAITKIRSLRSAVKRAVNRDGRGVGAKRGRHAVGSETIKIHQLCHLGFTQKVYIKQLCHACQGTTPLDRLGGPWSSIIQYRYNNTIISILYCIQTSKTRFNTVTHTHTLPPARARG